MRSSVLLATVFLTVAFTSTSTHADSLKIESIYISPRNPEPGDKCIATVRIKNLSAPIQSLSQSRDMGFIRFWSDRDRSPSRSDEKSSTISQYIGRMRNGETKTIRIPFRAPSRNGECRAWVRLPEPSQKDIGYTDSRAYTVGSTETSTKSAPNTSKRTADSSFDFSNDWGGENNMRVMAGKWEDKKGQNFTLKMDGTASGILGSGHWTVKSPKYLNKVLRGHHTFSVLYIYDPKTKEIFSASSIPYQPQEATADSTHYGFRMKKGDFVMGISSGLVRKGGSGSTMFLKRK